MTRRIVTWDLFGWGEIAAFLDVSERTARRWGAVGLPAYRVRGSVRARSEDVVAWLEARARPVSAEVTASDRG